VTTHTTFTANKPTNHIQYNTIQYSTAQYNNMVIFINTKKSSSENRWRNAGSSAGVGLYRGCKWCQSRSSSAIWKGSVLLLVLFSWYVAFLRPDPFDPFARPFCDANGNCHEKPDSPSPRTVYSSWNKKQYNLWWTYYETLKERVDDYAKKRQDLYDREADDHEQISSATTRTRPLILLGDSITESWSGTGLGIPKVRSEGIPQVLEDELSSSSGLDPIVLGMSGDQTQHLLYRLENGHMRAAQLASSMPSGDDETVLVYDPSAIFGVMIGTNNLGSGELPQPTAKGILAVVDYLLRETADAGCHVMLFRVLPRGDGRKILPTLCPPRCRDDGTPYDSFLPAIEQVNEAVARGVDDLLREHPSRISLVDCGSEFVNEEYDDQKPIQGVVDDNNNNNNNNNNYEVKKALMPDLLHPNAIGHRNLAKCIRDYIDQIDA